ncbi:protein CUSTOS-like [Ylistrum balloti]|uniref:protein CUSTOS-like n=1 Tax=Ylistrum balloti TaxID=509963 RepID=UPI002905813C|nr:protein CUSTOS-like [Ylistrum balloti]
MASDSDTDSSIEDESQRQRLLDAAVDIKKIVKSAGPNNGPVGMQSAVSRDRIVPNIPSKRPSQIIEHEEKHDLNTTPEFKAFVAKKLSQMLDEEVEEQKMDNRNLNPADYEDTGIRLCFGSSRHLKTECNPENMPTQRKPVPRKRANDTSSSDSSEEDERLAAAAVSHDFIVKQSKVFIGSKEGQSVIIHGEEAKNHQNGKDFVSNLEARDDHRTFTEVGTEEDLSKKKKKKKKKKKSIKENS